MDKLRNLYCQNALYCENVNESDSNYTTNCCSMGLPMAISLRRAGQLSSWYRRMFVEYHMRQQHGFCEL